MLRRYDNGRFPRKRTKNIRIDDRRCNGLKKTIEYFFGPLPVKLPSPIQMAAKLIPPVGPNEGDGRIFTVHFLVAPKGPGDPDWTNNASYVVRMAKKVTSSTRAMDIPAVPKNSFRLSGRPLRFSGPIFVIPCHPKIGLA
jgi:hypothetical protein